MRSEVAKELHREASIEPLSWCPDGFLIHEGLGRLLESRLVKEGEVFIQNASSFIPVIGLDPQPDDDILDLAAAPGGKASHIASLVRNEARLWLNDPLTPRIRKLRAVVQLLNVKAENITAFPAQYANKFIDQEFDRILLDAQCTGEGMVNLSRSDALKYWSLERVLDYGRLQQRMLVAAFKLLRPGGTLVYSTCTISPEENEAPVDHLLRHFPASVVPFPIDFPPAKTMPGLRSWLGREFHTDLSNAVRVWPGEFFEPFFVCRLQKIATD